ncbi:MAG TPA: helix-turn-helix domain-containing protein [Dehalococcoidia bacterium]|nr:helix-turn-helix domain-containing protein [Dehalococcoidia bacterium]
MQATRQEILDYLRRRSQATVKELGAHLGLTSTGIRQHLTILERDGLVEAREERGHVGRPALVYRLSDRGDALYPKKYDALANALIEEARALLGPEPLQRLMKNVAARFAEPYLPRLEGKTPRERVQEAAQILQERGCLADCAEQGEDALIRQMTCPFPNVATRNSAVCALEVEFVRRLVGADARLTTSLLRGDDACTYRIRAVPEPRSRP